MSAYSLQQLSKKLDQLLLKHEQLRRDNAQLREREAIWQRERQQLIDKNETARLRVEAMIGELKRLKEGVSG